ncbi:protein-glutamate O-methyltransferase CheR [Candidatus Ozemobacteraceae bacterium]|nr:protein-glutamate O-methyltransferase CheR [Candidatus Ozemobacteraceae bacterium]
MSRSFTPNEYAQLRDFLSREFGLFFDTSKVTFLENRVLPLIQKYGCRDMNGLISVIQSDQTRRIELLDIITTNETWFFRHPRHFDILREELLPSLLRSRDQEGQRRISIWSAGCSIGAEAYSIAITILEALRDPTPWKITIIGSDIAASALQRARAGVYTTTELKLLSSMLLTRYFVPTGSGEFRVKPELAALVRFEPLNLLDVWPDRKFDVIFCRNTMIYFKEATKTALTERIYKALEPGGMFFTSATETLHWKGDDEFEKLFIHGEYVYHKRQAMKSFILYRFQTPSDLLRALNLLVKFNHEYQLMNIPQTSPSSPRKALFVPQRLQSTVERLFDEAHLRNVGSGEFRK